MHAWTSVDRRGSRVARVHRLSFFRFARSSAKTVCLGSGGMQHCATRNVRGHAVINRSAIFLMDLSPSEIISRRRALAVAGAEPAPFRAPDLHLPRRQDTDR